MLWYHLSGYGVFGSAPYSRSVATGFRATNLSYHFFISCILYAPSRFPPFSVCRVPFVTNAATWEARPVVSLIRETLVRHPLGLPALSFALKTSVGYRFLTNTAYASAGLTAVSQGPHPSVGSCFSCFPLHPQGCCFADFLCHIALFPFIPGPYAGRSALCQVKSRFPSSFLHGQYPWWGRCTFFFYDLVVKNWCRFPKVRTQPYLLRHLQYIPRLRVHGVR